MSVFPERADQERRAGEGRSPDISFIAGLPRVRSASGALIRDEAERIMVVCPTYKDHWDIPGGMLEADESPFAACARELEEELGLELPVGRLLCVDWVPPRPPWDSGLMFVFDAGMLSTEQVPGIRLCPDELERFEFVAADEMDGVPLEPRPARRIRAATSALRAGRTAYLEDGLPLDASPP
ncbi:NUDIX hydrolase [Sphaerisporangium sp. NPDC049002]|uniref:NUDIX hydrolase n=1 Tax=unclassified Sphaerisporangium TaxID=2630420 RepID=UPI0033C09ACE